RRRGPLDRRGPLAGGAGRRADVSVVLLADRPPAGWRREVLRPPGRRARADLVAVRRGCLPSGGLAARAGRRRTVPARRARLSPGRCLLPRDRPGTRRW